MTGPRGDKKWKGWKRSQTRTLFATDFIQIPQSVPYHTRSGRFLWNTGSNLLDWRVSHPRTQESSWNLFYGTRSLWFIHKAYHLNSITTFKPHLFKSCFNTLLQLKPTSLHFDISEPTFCMHFSFLLCKHMFHPSYQLWFTYFRFSVRLQHLWKSCYSLIILHPVTL